MREWYELPHSAAISMHHPQIRETGMLNVMAEARIWCEERVGPESSRADLSQDSGRVKVYDGAWYTIYGKYFFLDQRVAFEFKMAWG